MLETNFKEFVEKLFPENSSSFEEILKFSR